MYSRLFKNLLPELEKEQEVFNAYAVMIKFLPQNRLDTFQESNGETSFESKRWYLEDQLLISTENFLKAAEKFLAPHLNTEKAANKKLFEDIIIRGILSDSPSSFLQTLCFCEASNALRIFVQKFPDAIKNLTDTEFNTICVVAAMNHQYDFLKFLCNQGRSIDNYAAILLRDSWDTRMTPLIAAHFRVILHKNDTSPEDRIVKGKMVLQLLLAQGADPTKKYTVEDISGVAIAGGINASPPAISIVDEAKNMLRSLVKTPRHDYVPSKFFDVIKPYVDFIASLEPKVTEANRSGLKS